jgi:hypothetical protein
MKRPKSMTKSALAAMLEISRQALNVYLRVPGHPPIHDVAAWHVLLAERGREGTAPRRVRAAIARTRLAILKENQTRLARENRIAEKEMMLNADAVRQASQAMAIVFDDLARDGRELPPACEGRPAVEIGEILSARIEKHRVAWKEKFSAIGK